MSLLTSATVAAGDDVTAAERNALRKDIAQVGGDYATSGGAANAYTLAVDAQVVAYTAGLTVKFKANHANTGTATMNVNAIGAKTIKRPDGSALRAGDIVVDQVVLLVYDGTDMRIVSMSKGDISIFGTGADGTVTINANTSLTKDMYYDTLTVTNNAVLTTMGYRIFVKNVLTIDAGSFIRWNGQAGGNGTNAGNASTPGNGGAAGAANTTTNLYGGPVGVTGGQGGTGGTGGGGTGSVGSAGTAGTNVANSFATVHAVLSGAGGTGGANGAGAGGRAGGASGAVGSVTAGAIRPYTPVFAIRMLDEAPNATPQAIKYQSGVGGAGGGGGGYEGCTGGQGGSGGGGGGSGSGGGTIMICARVLVNNGTIECKGGAGGNGGTGGTALGGASCGGGGHGGGGGGGGGAGSGGPGGTMVLITSSSSGSGTTSIAGGAAGTVGTGGPGGVGTAGGNNGANGANGATGSTGPDGVKIEIDVTV